MFDRIAIAIALIVVGLAAYQTLLFAQRRMAARGSKIDRCAASGKPALLVFTSPTCGPCKLQQMPIVNRLMVDWHDKIDLNVIDVTEQPEVASRYGVWSLPTTIVLDADRQVAAINQGVASDRKLREEFAKVSTNGQRIIESARKNFESILSEDVNS
jgi:thioredoxin-like negative regulator of GroEL